MDWRELGDVPAVKLHRAPSVPRFRRCIYMLLMTRAREIPFRVLHAHSHRYSVCTSDVVVTVKSHHVAQRSCLHFAIMRWL
jgi:hypothetical protein